eukprot:CAMPEP_0172775930 /NCGR_PEP_ID=MMETSP1074-20121228/198915_1 /TAXON_ID=2916 /ORGANISM="Ceratium fusus, Strain PA161109" /LENGTH=199 /DNA_ID=CAMNT_0013612615 /DNA_START=165 /DNA_END=764 /DNA_ORIENTATION=-
MTALPDEVVVCDGIQAHPVDARVACLQLGGQTVGWLMLVDVATCSRFMKSTLPVIQATPMVLANNNGHTADQQQQAAGEMQLQAVQAQLKRHETELAAYRLRLSEGSSGPPPSTRQSFPVSRGPRAKRSQSVSSSSGSDKEPLMLGGDEAMDWPLSRAEKNMRLLQIMERERAATEQQNRRLLRRKSGPEPAPRAAALS